MSHTGFYPGDRVVGDVLVARRLSWKRIFRDFRVTRTVDRERLESPQMTRHSLVYFSQSTSIGQPTKLSDRSNQKQSRP